MASYRTAPINCARRLAGQWGEVQRQRKLAEGMWEFSCSGHGGIVADLDVYPEFEDWKGFVPISNRGDSRFRGYRDEQHFAVFEEDCDWSIPYAFHFDLLVNERNYARYVKDCHWTSDPKTYDEWREWMRDLVDSSIRNWHHHLIDDGRVELAPEQLALAI